MDRTSRHPSAAQSAGPEELQRERHDRICLLRLNRPQRLNALTFSLRNALADALEDCAQDGEVACVVITGAGDRGFCAGQDLHESSGLDASAGDAWMRSWQRYFHTLGSFPKPIVAAVNGVAAGAGFQTALMADVRVAVEEARFLMAEVDVGLPAIVGGHLLAIHLGRSRAQELVLSGRTFGVEEARATGLIRHVSSRTRLLKDALAIAQELAAKPPKAMELTVGRFREMTAQALSEAESAAVAYQSEAIASGQPQAVMQDFFRKDRVRAG